jgi:Niemann-Pick C1 protein
VQKDLLAIQEQYSGLTYMNDVESWYPPFRAWYADYVAPLLPDGTVPSDGFYDYLRQFLQTACVDENGAHGPCGLFYQDDIVFSGQDSVSAVRLPGQTTPLKSQRDYIRSYEEAYAAADDAVLNNVFPYSIYYVFFAQYAYIAKVALIALSAALGAVLIVSWLLLGSLYASVLVILVVSMIVVDLWGFMALWGVDVNAVSVVNVMMAVGISVEFCIHIVKSFLYAAGSGSQRAKHAVSEVGAAVFAGITLTKFFGVVPLAFAHSMVFEIYYFRMFMLMVLLGAFHGLLVLPVLLALAGPEQKRMSKHVSVDEDRQRTARIITYGTM